MKKDRLEKIYRYVEEHGDASTQELTSAFGVSNMTIRRDLDELEGQGKISRFHGGAKMVQEEVQEASFDQRTRTNHEYKMDIARCAIALLKARLQPRNPMCIYMGTGSTIYCMAGQLDVKLPAPIVTDNLYVASMLMSGRENMVIMLGGQLSLPSMGAMGYLAEKNLSELALDMAFVGTSALDEEGNLYTFNLTQASMFSKIIQVARHVVVMADHSKLGRRNLVHVGKLDSRFTLITDEEAPPEYLKRYRELGAHAIAAKR